MSTTNTFLHVRQHQLTKSSTFAAPMCIHETSFTYKESGTQSHQSESLHISDEDASLEPGLWSPFDAECAGLKGGGGDFGLVSSLLRMSRWIGSFFILLLVSNESVDGKVLIGTNHDVINTWYWLMKWNAEPLPHVQDFLSFSQKHHHWKESNFCTSCILSL